MDELIANAYLAAGRIADDLAAICAKATQVKRPEGLTAADKALAAYLQQCWDTAYKLQSDLLRIAP